MTKLHQVKLHGRHMQEALCPAGALTCRAAGPEVEAEWLLRGALARELSERAAAAAA